MQESTSTTSQSIKESRVPAAQQETQPGKGQTDEGGRKPQEEGRWEEWGAQDGREDLLRKEPGKGVRSGREAGRERRRSGAGCRRGDPAREPRGDAGGGDGDPGWRPGDGGPPAAEPRYLTICRAAAGTGPGSRPPPPPG